ncbi:MBL fold metallo-hydrolase [Sinimarinibacterium thermocellulolyticum]|uniref:MBL fold metallo-hydrolase n=1 Tax=Sinimarinibacterium thermocellulolyticum TaxID=3170016 RepID=A0ABV2A753_9GAMM
MMRAVSWILVVAVGIGIGALVWSFAPRTLPLSPSAPLTLSLMIPPQPPPTMRVGVLHTGLMRSRGLFAYRGGDAGERVFGMDVVIVEHPQGTLLFDAGFGRRLHEHLRTIPWLMRLLSAVELQAPVVDQLVDASIAPASIDGVVLTHAHWDHVSGLDDLPGVPVWINQAELDFIRSGHPATRLARELGERDYRIYAFDGPPYWGFDASHDVFGDGSVVLVPAGGHTPGSTIAFIHAPDGRSYALIGDLAWQREGVDLPAERPWLLRKLVDGDDARVREVLVRLHLLQRAMPQLVIVPAHDRRVMQRLPPARHDEALHRGHPA